MNEDEFKIEISRELGAIDSRLASIERLIGSNADVVKTLWSKFDNCRESHSATDKWFIKKIYAVSGGIAVAITIIGYFFEKIVK